MIIDRANFGELAETRVESWEGRLANFGEFEPSRLN